jgi:hypothetical protein
MNISSKGEGEIERERMRKFRKCIIIYLTLVYKTNAKFVGINGNALRYVVRLVDANHTIRHFEHVVPQRYHNKLSILGALRNLVSVRAGTHSDWRAMRT